MNSSRITRERAANVYDPAANTQTQISASGCFSCFGWPRRNTAANASAVVAPPPPRLTPAAPAHPLPRLALNGEHMWRLPRAGDSLQWNHRVYTLEKVVGSGTFGTVFRAHTKSGEIVALKVVNVRDSSIEKANHEYRKACEEVTIHRHCNGSSPYVADLHDFYIDAPQALRRAWGAFIILVTDYAAGGELFDYVARLRHPMSEAKALRLFAQLALGVDAIHQCNVIHRDIKLENILLDDSENPTRLMLIDFGLSKLCPPESGIRPRSPAGSIAYAAPEILVKAVDKGLRDRPYDGRIDVWSMGAVLHGMLLGYLPVDLRKGDNPGEAYHQLTAAGLKLHGLSEATQDLLRGMLHLDPHGRLTLKEVLKHPALAPHLPASSATNFPG